MKLCANNECEYNSVELLPPLDTTPYWDFPCKNSMNIKRITRYLYRNNNILYYLCEQCHLDSVKHHKKYSK